MFPSEDIFHPGNKQKKSCLGQDWVNREGGAQGSGGFWSKTTEHLTRCGLNSYITHHEMDKGTERMFKKIH